MTRTTDDRLPIGSNNKFIDVVTFSRFYIKIVFPICISVQSAFQEELKIDVLLVWVQMLFANMLPHYAILEEISRLCILIYMYITRVLSLNEQTAVTWNHPCPHKLHAFQQDYIIWIQLSVFYKGMIIWLCPSWSWDIIITCMQHAHLHCVKRPLNVLAIINTVQSQELWYNNVFVGLKKDRGRPISTDKTLKHEAEQHTQHRKRWMSEYNYESHKYTIINSGHQSH